MFNNEVFEDTFAISLIVQSDSSRMLIILMVWHSKIIHDHYTLNQEHFGY